MSPKMFTMLFSSDDLCVIRSPVNAIRSGFNLFIWSVMRFNAFSFPFHVAACISDMCIILNPSNAFGIFALYMSVLLMVYLFQPVVVPYMIMPIMPSARISAIVVKAVLKFLSEKILMIRFIEYTALNTIFGITIARPNMK